MADNVIILFAHGARDPQWAGPVEAVAAKLRTVYPNRLIEVSFLEFMHPTLDEAVAKVIAAKSPAQGLQIHILPFFIAQGGHLRKELPEMLGALRAQYPEQRFNLLSPLGELPEVQTAMADAIARLIP